MKWLFLFSSTAYATVALFTPPQGWERVERKKPTRFVKVGYVKLEGKEGHSTINLAEEKVDVSLKKYVRAVKELHKEDRQVELRDLGPFLMKGGKGHLLELTIPSSFGKKTLLQAILLKNEKAFLLTASFLKKNFAKMQKEVLSSLKSLDCRDELFDFIEDEQIGKSLKLSFEKIEENRTNYQDFAKQVLELKNLGSYWQYLAIQEGVVKVKNK